MRMPVVRLVLPLALALVASPAEARFLSVDPVTADSGDQRHFNRYVYAYDNPYRFTDPDGRCPQCAWGVPIGAGVNLTAQLLAGDGSFGQRWSNVSWKQVGAAGIAGGLSGGVSAIASTAATTSGVIAANVLGNAGVGAVATHANAYVVGETATVGEVLLGAGLSGGTSGMGATLKSFPQMQARSASAGMTQTERTATANLLEGIREATPGFTYSSGLQPVFNAGGSAMGASSGLVPLLLQDDSR